MNARPHATPKPSKPANRQTGKPHHKRRGVGESNIETCRFDYGDEYQHLSQLNCGAASCRFIVETNDYNNCCAYECVCGGDVLHKCDGRLTLHNEQQPNQTF
ncbi:unnamed protein product [Ceratitis capitata]|uniref:(Mediterranean fruit fly) hypothetical protein n=1 Tax=Ceratitis capitata TaxID=7213 RepID=A0A811V5R2_CERCA|nr:unnamed protein product [Ceratitis capitata]